MMQAEPMRSSLLFLLCVTTLLACRDQRRACTEAFGEGPTQNEGLLNRCMAFCFEAGE